MQKSVTRGFPAWLERVEVPKKGGTVHHPLVNDARALRWLANQNCITPHVWACRVPDLGHPDICIFDLDPSVDDAAALRAATLQVRDFLAVLGLTSHVKTSGSKGFHVAVSLDGTADVGNVSWFAHHVGAALVRLYPASFTQEFLKVDRGERILLDTGRNHPPATFAAAYAVRARPGAPVSAPCTWAEVESGAVGPRTLTLRNLPSRVAALGDPWSDLATTGQSLTTAMERLRNQFRT
jgi:bifunctional non-homologous end joining protein LigD